MILKLLKGSDFKALDEVENFPPAFFHPFTLGKTRMTVSFLFWFHENEELLQQNITLFGTKKFNDKKRCAQKRKVFFLQRNLLILFCGEEPVSAMNIEG